MHFRRVLPFVAIATFLGLLFAQMSCIGAGGDLRYSSGSGSASSGASGDGGDDDPPGTEENPPMDDFAEAEGGGYVDIKVLNNDFGFELGNLQIATVTRPPNGTIQWNPNDPTEPIRYWPGRAFVGIDSFRYALLLEDGTQSSYATVYVTVTPLLFSYLDLEALWVAEPGSLPMGGISDFVIDFGLDPENGGFGVLGARFDEGPETPAPWWQSWDFDSSGKLTLDLGWVYSGGAETKLKLTGQMSEDKDFLYCDYTVMYLGGPMPGGEAGTVTLKRFDYPDSILAGAWAGRMWNDSSSSWTNLLLDFSEFQEEVVLNEYIFSGIRYTPTSGLNFSWEIDEDGLVEFSMSSSDPNQLVSNTTVFYMQFDASLQRMEGYYERSIVYTDAEGVIWFEDNSSGSVEFEGGVGHYDMNFLGEWEGYISTNTGSVPVLMKFEKWYGHENSEILHFAWGSVYWGGWGSSFEQMQNFDQSFDGGPKGDAGLVLGTMEMKDSSDILFTGLVNNGNDTLSASVYSEDGSVSGLMHLSKTWSPE